MDDDAQTIRLVDFYVADGRDDAGRTFEQVLALGDAQLEHSHDYIQWIFPLLTHSQAVPGAPVLGTRAIVRLRSEPTAQARVLAALTRMLAFYGLELDDDPEEPFIERSSRWPSRSSAWLTPGNHNYLRLTRMLTSLQLQGRAIHAHALFNCLAQIHRDHGGRIGPAFAHWCAAVGATQSSRPTSSRS